MKKILVVITTSFVPWGGLATVAMNYYRAMDKSNLRIDFASSNDAPSSLVNEVKENGGKYIRLPQRKKTIIKYMIELYRNLKLEKYEVIHIHGNSATMTFELFSAWLSRVRNRIVHVHNTKNQHYILDKILRPIFNILLTERIAVSHESGHYMYGKKKYIILNNAIDLEHYQFDNNARLTCREFYGIPKDAFVVGTVGKLNHQKNQKFLIEIFSNVKKYISNTVLMIVGGGELEKELIKKINSLGIEDCCILVGMKEDTAEFLSAMDVFVLPSLYEGLPLSAVEAQACALPTIVSSNVSSQTGCTDLFEQLELDKGEEFWAQKIVEIREQGVSRLENREKEIKIIGFDIQQECIKLERIYGVEDGVV